LKLSIIYQGSPIIVFETIFSLKTISCLGPIKFVRYQTPVMVTNKTLLS